MTTKKSRARQVAERLTEANRSSSHSDGAQPRWTRAMVEKTVLTFEQLRQSPPSDDAELRRWGHELLRFQELIRRGGVDADVLPLAEACVDRGLASLAAHPEPPLLQAAPLKAAPLTTGRWTLHMVEQLVLVFEQERASIRGARDVLDLALRVRTFEDVVERGAVEPGEAEDLAVVFLAHARTWLSERPELGARR